MAPLTRNFAWLYARRGFVLVALIVIAAVLGKLGVPFVGMWDGPG